MGDALDFIARRHFGILEIGLAQLAIGKIPQAVGDAPQAQAFGFLAFTHLRIRRR
jgi:hypothetical protein